MSYNQNPRNAAPHKNTTAISDVPKYSINWTAGTSNEYIWNLDCVHHAIPLFDGFKKISGTGPQFIKVGPGSQLYGCFEDGGGRNYYGSHKLEIIKL